MIWPVHENLRPGLRDLDRHYSPLCRAQFHTATLLPNGQVLVAGGSNMITGPSATAELYDPASGSGAMPQPQYTRSEQTATLLPMARS